VLDRPESWDDVVTALGRIGYEQVLGYLQDGMERWKQSGSPLARVEQIDVHGLSSRQPGLKVLDVRMDSEWAAGTIGGAQRIPLHDLPDRISEIDLEQPMAVVCSTGYRSTIAASLLRRAGAGSVASVLGGMTAWVAAGLPVEKEDGSTSGQAPKEPAELAAAAPGRSGR
jgi:hydroxyacylglutathione hydrolase